MDVAAEQEDRDGDDLAGFDREAALGQLDSKRFELLGHSLKVCGEALAFIRKINVEMDTIALLLGSTHKAEVLESMDFFCIAHQYGLDRAKVSDCLFP